MNTTVKARKIEEEVLAVLARCTYKECYLKLPEQLPRDLYMAVNKVLLAAGGKWSRREIAHIFDGDAAEIMEPIILTGEYLKPQDFGFFETPAELVRQIIFDARIVTTMKVLEPSAGTGRIVLAAQNAGGAVFANELDEERAQKVDVILGKVGRRCMRGDFLGMVPMPVYDRVLMNPPFAKRADVRHIIHAEKFVKPGGMLISIASSAAMYRDDTLARSFRSMVSGYGGKIEPLPENSFAESGTHVNTCVVMFSKPEAVR